MSTLHPFANTLCESLLNLNNKGVFMKISDEQSNRIHDILIESYGFYEEKGVNHLLEYLETIKVSTQTDTQQIKCEMPKTCASCPKSPNCSCEKGSICCQAALFRHYTHL